MDDFEPRNPTDLPQCWFAVILLIVTMVIALGTLLVAVTVGIRIS